MKTRVLAVLSAGLFCISGCPAAHKGAVDERNLAARVNDDRVESAILAKFRGDETIKPLDLSAKSFGGEVYLVGEYESPAQQSRAVAIVKEVEGIRSFTLYLLPRKKLNSCEPGDNLKIRGEVEAKLAADRSLRSANVHVRAVQCRVVLLGILETQAEIQKSIAHAKSVKGVQEVKSFLRPNR